ncbi:MAG: class I adenylate-forming enzyme family protein [Eubacteriales bacterium]|nr:class I adenylate-forming enzyme family protein [Eubacteriales bacterium]
MKQTSVTGKPSVDRPWMKYYPQALLDMIQLPDCTLEQYLREHCPGMEVPAVEYYGEQIRWASVFEETDQIARSLRALGFGEGDQIPTFWRMVPEFVPMLLAAERIGASILCRDNTIEENVEAAVKSGAKAIFVHDFLTQKELEKFRKGGIQTIVVLPTMQHGSRKDMPEHNRECLDSYYIGQLCSAKETLSWDMFLKIGNYYVGDLYAPTDTHRPLYRCYTSGSTGPSKQVIHSADTMLGIICQMNFYGSAEGFRPNWLVTCLPPSLVAVVVCMVLLPMASNKLLILDPFVFEEDVDLEIMRYKANNWPQIPLFMETIMRSKRIPDDYDMSHLLAGGAGCEAINNNQLRRAQKYFDSHGCKFRYTTGYGCSEAGSNVTLHMSPKPLGNGNVGVPLPLSIISIFKPGTQEELGYNQVGEICKTGVGNMLGYDDPKATAKALQLHQDGNVWLHMGDLGYMDEDGVIYVVTRGQSPRHGGGYLDIQTMENRVADADIPGIDDEFFVNCPDEEHEGCFLPYLFVVLKPGHTVDDIRDAVDACLEPHMRPEEIIALKERPFWHFKTNRIGLSKEIIASRRLENAV